MEENKDFESDGFLEVTTYLMREKFEDFVIVSSKKDKEGSGFEIKVFSNTDVLKANFLLDIGKNELLYGPLEEESS